MKIAVCDDEKQFIDEVCPLLESWAQKHDVRLSLYQFTNGDDLIETHRNECMDLIFLDVIMPLLSGMETARELRRGDATVPIIFLTSTKEYALDSYDVRAFHYLLKPVDDGKLFCVLDDFLKTFCLPKHRFTAKTTEGFCKITLSDVEYLEAQNKHVLAYFSNGKVIEICEQLSKCEKIFSAENGFCRCHRSYIVNLNHVEQFSKSSLTTICHATIPISRSNYAAFKEAYFLHMFR